MPESPFAVKYAKLRDLVMRAENYGTLNETVRPNIFLEWVKRNDIEFPAELEKQINARLCEGVDWKKRYTPKP